MAIVCGTDFSERSVQAGRVAGAIARRLGERLELVHAVEGLGAEDAIAVEAPELAPARARLEEQAEALARAGTSVEAVLRGGPADEVLVAHASRTSAKMIVVSSLGESKRVRWLVGSVAERTAQASTVPVLVTRKATPLEAWALGEGALRALVATDLEPSSQAALAWVAGLGAVGRLEVTALHLAWPLREHERLGVEGPAPLDRLRPEVEGALARELEACLASAGLRGAKLDLRPSVGRADVDLLRIAGEIHADLVVVGSHQRAGLDRVLHGSVARGVLHGAPMSVACVPATASVEVRENASAPAPGRAAGAR